VDRKLSIQLNLAHVAYTVVHKNYLFLSVVTSMIYSRPFLARIALTATMSSPPNSWLHSSAHSLYLSITAVNHRQKYHTIRWRVYRALECGLVYYT